MTNEETGVALMIPELHTKAELVTVSIRGSAHDHLLAWDASQRLVAIHESGHACAAAALGIAEVMAGSKQEPWCPGKIVRRCQAQRGFGETRTTSAGAAIFEQVL